MELHREPILYYFGLLLIICTMLIGAKDAKGQDSPNVDSLVTAMDPVQEAEAIYSSAEGDTLRVWWNIRGEARVWRLQYASGVLWAKTLTGGTFRVLMDTEQAIRLLEDNQVRTQVEALVNDCAVTGDVCIVSF